MYLYYIFYMTCYCDTHFS